MIKTRLTEFLNIDHPIISAPMAFAGGGKLAAAVTRGGGLGMIGGGYGDQDWLNEQFEAAGNTAVGCGFITWSLADNPHFLDLVLQRSPKAIMLSFGDPTIFSKAIHDEGVKLICQVQSMEHARAAVDAGAHIIVAQGNEAGGHSAHRATITLVPEVADYLAKYSTETILVAAGGIADGRGLAASLMLGAEGVLMGTRFWMSEEALVHQNFQSTAIKSSGDETACTKTVDVVRRRDWPDEFNIRVWQNQFTLEMQKNLDEGDYDLPAIIEKYESAAQVGDVDNTGVIFGEAAGMINQVQPAETIIAEIVQQAQSILNGELKNYSLTDA